MLNTHSPYPASLGFYNDPIYSDLPPLLPLPAIGKPQTKPEAVRILLIDDQQLGRQGLKIMLGQKAQFAIVGESSDLLHGAELSMALKPDIILVGMHQCTGEFLEALRHLKVQLPQSRLIILTSITDEHIMNDVLKIKVNAYCLTSINIDMLYTVVDWVKDGAVWLDPRIAKGALKALSGPKIKQPTVHLTHREVEVAKMVIDGKNNEEISLALDISIHTAKAHVCQILGKLGAKNRVELAVKALRFGIIK